MDDPWMAKVTMVYVGTLSELLALGIDGHPQKILGCPGYMYIGGHPQTVPGWPK